MPTEKDSGFRFDSIRLRELRFEDKDTSSPAHPTRELELRVEVGIDVPEDESRASVTLNLVIKPKDSEDFDTLSIVLVGVFVPTADEYRTKLEEFAQGQGAALLFPFIREIVANVTARSRGGVILIPPLNLYQLRTESQKAAEAKS